MTFIDSHCHLDDKVLFADLPNVLARARQVGVKKIITIGTNKNEWPQVMKLAEENADVYASVGIHPNETSSDGGTTTMEELLALADASPKLVAFGETGLDFHYNHAPPETQIASFRLHIRAAREKNLPIVVHTRDADEETYRIMAEEGAVNAQHPLRGVLHCFTSGMQLAQQAIAMGFYISFSGILTFKNAAALRDIAKIIPLDKILIETDAPWLAPEPFRGRPCEPSYVVKTAEKLAELRGIPLDDFARQTTQNAETLFNLNFN